MPCEDVYALRGDTVCNNQGVARQCCMCAQRETASCPVLRCPSVTGCSAANLRRAAQAPGENRADCPTTPGPGAPRQSPQFLDPSSRSAPPAAAAGQRWQPPAGQTGAPPRRKEANQAQQSLI